MGLVCLAEWASHKPGLSFGIDPGAETSLTLNFKPTIPTFVKPPLRGTLYAKASKDVVRKFFPLDKNYLLEEAQLLLQDSLLPQLIEKVKQEYGKLYNPLGIPDELSLRVKKYQPKNLKQLHPFYQNLAGVYRYKFGENQLEFLWDGSDHFEKYKAEWAEVFRTWTSQFCKKELFIRAVLDLTVFLPENRNAQLAENRMNHFILQNFEVRIHKQRGIADVRVA